MNVTSTKTTDRSHECVVAPDTANQARYPQSAEQKQGNRRVFVVLQPDPGSDGARQRAAPTVELQRRAAIVECVCRGIAARACCAGSSLARASVVGYHTLAGGAASRATRTSRYQATTQTYPVATRTTGHGSTETSREIRACLCLKVVPLGSDPIYPVTPFIQLAPCLVIRLY